MKDLILMICNFYEKMQKLIRKLQKRFAVCKLRSADLKPVYVNCLPQKSSKLKLLCLA